MQISTVFHRLFSLTNTVLVPVALGMSTGVLVIGTEREKKVLVQTSLKCIRIGSQVGTAAFILFSPWIAIELMKKYAQEPELMVPAAVTAAVSSVFLAAAEGAKWGLMVGAMKVITRRY